MKQSHAVVPANVQACAFSLLVLVYHDAQAWPFGRLTCNELPAFVAPDAEGDDELELDTPVDVDVGPEVTVAGDVVVDAGIAVDDEEIVVELGNEEFETVAS